MIRTTSMILLASLVASCGGETRNSSSSDARKKGAAVNLDVTTSQEFAKKHTDFKSYWFRGQAELNRFELQQSRYGELHEGEAVMVFVTEPFLPDKQVKQDFGNDPSVQVLKNNFYRRFYTGVYPYSIMTSTFTPALTAGPTIKLTQTVQEWCGHVFAQLNLNDARDGFDATSYSYFQAEGDEKLALPGTLLEDDLYTRIRLGPDTLPTGQIDILPSVTYLRLAHKKWTVRQATATLSDPGQSDFSDAPVRTYKIEYTNPDRVLAIHFEAAFPYRVVGFEDTYEAIFNPEGGQPEKLTTVGRLTKSIMLDYWTKNGTADAAWRDALGLVQ